jgi:hypothetical protein
VASSLTDKTREENKREDGINKTKTLMMNGSTLLELSYLRLAAYTSIMLFYIHT